MHISCAKNLAYYRVSSETWTVYEGRFMSALFCFSINTVKS